MTDRFQDVFLNRHCTPERLNRAYAHIEGLSLDGITDEWRERLATLRTYVIVCLECQASPEDLFAEKLKHYRAEWETGLLQAKAAAPTSDGGRRSLFTVDLERG